MELFNQIKSNNKLSKTFKYIVEKNKSNDAPYHDLNHLLTVTDYCYKIAKDEKLLNDDIIDDFLIAAMFHDFNHSMGKKDDSDNIKIAKREIFKFNNKYKLDLDIEFIESVLDATQYPYVINKEDLNIYQKIIRDADLCQIFEPNWFQQIIMGLSNELNIDVGEFIGMQKKFLGGIEFETNFCQNLKKKHWDKVMSNIDFLGELFNKK